MRGSIRALPGGRWRLNVDVGPHPSTGRRRQLTRHVTGTRGDAETALARLLVDVGAGIYVGHDATLDQAIDAWLDVARLAVTTRRDFTFARKHLPARLTRMPVWKVRAHHLDALYAQLARDGLGPDRIRRVHSIVRSALAQAVRWGWVARNPAVDASPPSPPPPRPRPPTVEQVRALIAGAGAELVVWLRVEAGLGARRGEICALQWGDIDLDRGEVLISRALADGGPGLGIVVKSTKTGTERRVSIDTFTVAVLRDHRRIVARLRLLVAEVESLSERCAALERTLDRPEPPQPTPTNRPPLQHQRSYHHRPTL